MPVAECSELKRRGVDSCLRETTHQIKHSGDFTFTEGVENLINSRNGKFVSDANVIKSFIVTVTQIALSFFETAISGEA